MRAGLAQRKDTTTAAAGGISHPVDGRAIALCPSASLSVIPSAARLSVIPSAPSAAEESRTSALQPRTWSRDHGSFRVLTALRYVRNLSWGPRPPPRRMKTPTLVSSFRPPYRGTGQAPSRNPGAGDVDSRVRGNDMGGRMGGAAKGKRNPWGESRSVNAIALRRSREQSVHGLYGRGGTNIPGPAPPCGARTSGSCP